MRPATSDGETTSPATLDFERVGNSAQMLGKGASPPAERKQLTEDWLEGRGRDLVGLHRTYGISRETEHRRVQRFPAGGYPGRSGGCKGVTHRAGLTLLHPLSTAKIINVVAGWLPLSAKTSAHPDVPVSQGTTAKPPSRPAEGARSSVPSVTDH